MHGSVVDAPSKWTLTHVGEAWGAEGRVIQLSTELVPSIMKIICSMSMTGRISRDVSIVVPWLWNCWPVVFPIGTK